MVRTALLIASAVALLLGCAGSSGSLPEESTARRSAAALHPAGDLAVRTAVSMIGAPYRYGGASPSGFDCSGLVVYSYARAGRPGLPQSASELERIAKPISLDELEPGDLLFFQLSRKKTSHVGIYVGDRTFVHAPSSGKRVERVRFDHVYWSRHLGRAGRLTP